MGGIDCVRDSKVGTPYPPLSGPTPRNGKSVSHVYDPLRYTPRMDPGALRQEEIKESVAYWADFEFSPRGARYARRRASGRFGRRTCSA